MTKTLQRDIISGVRMEHDMETFTVTLKHFRTMKNSERYDSDERDAKVKSLYIGKDAFFDGQPRPDSIKVTVETAS